MCPKFSAADHDDDEVDEDDEEDEDEEEEDEDDEGEEAYDEDGSEPYTGPQMVLVMTTQYAYFMLFHLYCAFLY